MLVGVLNFYYHEKNSIQDEEPDTYSFVFVGHPRSNEYGKLNPKFVKILNNLKQKRIDALFLAGDVIAGYRDTYEEQKNEYLIFKEEVFKTLEKKVDVYVAAGNHDYCTDYQRSVFFDLWGRDGKGYYFQDIEASGLKLRFIILDTMDSWYLSNEKKEKSLCNTKVLSEIPNLGGGQISGDQLSFLKKTFESESIDYYFVFLGHHRFLNREENSYWYKNVHPVFKKEKTFVFSGDQPVPHESFYEDGIFYYASGVDWEDGDSDLVDFNLIEIDREGLVVKTVSLFD